MRNPGNQGSAGASRCRESPHNHVPQQQLVAGWVTVLIFAVCPAGAAAEDSIEPKFLGNVRQVTPGLLKAGEAYFSSDGNKLMWTSKRTANRTSQLWVADFKLPQ